MIDETITQDLKAYLDGELSPERAEVVRAALESSPELRKEAEFMKMLGFEIKKLATEPAVQGRAKAIDAVKKSGGLFGWSRQPRYRFTIQLLVVCMCCAAVAAIIFPVFAQAKYSAKNAMEVASSKTAPDSMRQDRAAGGMAGEAEGADVKFRAPERSRGMAGGAGAPSSQSMKDSSIANEAPASSPDTSAKLSAAATRMVVKNGNLSVQVDDVKKAHNEAMKLAKSLGGFIASDSMTSFEESGGSSTLVLRVPSPQFETTMQKLGEMGTLLTSSSSGDDVTAQFADVTARMKTLKAEEDSLRTMLRSATKLGDILNLKDRISEVRSNIDSFEAQAASLKGLSSLSTITAEFSQKPKPKPVGSVEPNEDPFAKSWASAVGGLYAAGEWIGKLCINVFVYSPIWVPILFAIRWLNRRMQIV